MTRRTAGQPGDGGRTTGEPAGAGRTTGEPADGGRTTAQGRRPVTAAWADVWADLRPSISSRAAATIMFLVFLLSDLAAGRLHVADLTGLGFAMGSAAAAGFTRQRDLLNVATTPPVIFLGAVICAQLITAHTDHQPLSAATLAGGILLTLSGSAPWLFCGLGVALVIATVRGLPQCIRDLRAELAGPMAARRPRGGQ